MSNNDHITMKTCEDRSVAILAQKLLLFRSNTTATHICEMPGEEWCKCHSCESCSYWEKWPEMPCCMAVSKEAKKSGFIWRFQQEFPGVDHRLCQGCLDEFLAKANAKKNKRPRAAASLQQQGMASCAAEPLQTGAHGQVLKGSKQKSWRKKNTESSGSGEFPIVALDHSIRSDSSASMQQVDSGQIGELKIGFAEIKAQINVLNQNMHQMNEGLRELRDEILLLLKNHGT